MTEPETTDETIDVADPSVYTLQEYPETLAVVRLGAGAEVPDWAESSSIFSVTATAHETSVVCAARSVPTKARHQRGFTAFAVEGPLDFALTGVLLALLFPLAEEEISVFVLSTYDTDWLLVPQNDATRAAEAWRSHGHTVNAAVPAKRVKATKPSAGKAKP